MNFLDKLEDRILQDANSEWFSDKFHCSAKHRITAEQARCVIRAWAKHVMPWILDEENDPPFDVTP